MQKEKSKKHNHQFKKHKIKDNKNDAIEDLVAIYKDTDETEETQAPGSEVTGEEEADLSFKKIIEKDRGRRKMKIVAAILTTLFLCAAAAFGGFLFFSKAKKVGETKVILEIEAPEKVKIGETFDYTIKYQNLTEATLLKTRLNIQYPHGFVLEKSAPENVVHDFLIGSLPFPQSGELKLTGKIVDDITKEQTLKAHLIFSPDNFSSDFTKDAAISTMLEAPDIDLSTELPANITAGQKINIVLRVKNTSDLTFDNARIVFNKPESFVLQSVKPAAQKDNKEWDIVKIEPKKEITEITVEGNFPKDITFTKEEERNQNFSFQLLLKGAEENYYLAKEQTFSTRIIDQAINTFMIINGSTENKGIEPGGKLNFSIIAKNTGQQTFNDLKLKAVISPTPFDILDWAKISDANFGKIEKTDQGKEIIWDKSHLSSLGDFGPGKEQTINFSLPIKTMEDLNKENYDITLLGKTLIDCQSVVVFANNDIVPIKSSPVQLRLNTNIDLKTTALYYLDDGTVLGEGPLPPRVDQKTTLQIFWNISNDLHEITDITVSTTLPENINWSNKTHVEAGEINYDSATRKVTWKINRLPISIKTSQASFAIDFTPKAEDVGKLLKLTNNTTLSARDKETETILVETRNILTSALESDEHAQGQGVVIP